MTDPFAAVAAQQGAPQNTVVADTSGNLTTAFTGETSQLFGGAIMPSSLFNKTHLLGSVRTGKIVKAPYDVHSRTFDLKEPKYWAVTKVDGNAITTNPKDPITGAILRPVLDTVIEVQTEYRFNAAECAAIKRDATLPDDGLRAFYVSGNDLKLLQAEIRRLGLKDGEAMVGLTLTVKRAGQKPNPKGNDSWVNEIQLSH